MTTTKAGGRDTLPKKGTEAGRRLRTEAAKEERKGSDLKKGAARFEERAKSAGGGGAET